MTAISLTGFGTELFYQNCHYTVISRNIKHESPDFLKYVVVIVGVCSQAETINVSVTQATMLSPTLFLLHFNRMLYNNSIHCYADDRTVDIIYAGRVNISRAQVDENQNRLVSGIETSLVKVSQCEQNLISLNPHKTQACALSTKNNPFIKVLICRNNSLLSLTTLIF